LACGPLSKRSLVPEESRPHHVVIQDDRIYCRSLQQKVAKATKVFVPSVTFCEVMRKET